MIDAVFEFTLPNRNWTSIYETSGKTPFPYKFWELSIHRDNVIFGFSFQWSVKTDHAGVFSSISLFRTTIQFDFYDNRHWDDETNSWENA